MAGSYQHVLHGWSLIDNMGDAYEATEELMWLIQSQIGEIEAKKLLDEKFYPMARCEQPKDEHIISVQEMMNT